MLGSVVIVLAGPARTWAPASSTLQSLLIEIWHPQAVNKGGQQHAVNCSHTSDETSETTDTFQASAYDPKPLENLRHARYGWSCVECERKHWIVLDTAALSL